MALGALVIASAAQAASSGSVPPAHASDYVVTENAHSGGYFAAASTTSSGGGAYQDIALNTSAGQTVCGSAWVRTQVPYSGGSGTFALFLMGGSATDGGGSNFSGLGFGDNWSQVQTCVEATGAHSTLRVQFYPTPGGPTIEMDDIDVDVSLAANGGFETGSSSWSPYPGTNTNYVVYGNGDTTAHSGTHFAATNTTSDQGSIYQDIALNTSAGQTVCASAWVRTEGSATGAGGTFGLFLLGGATIDSGGTAFSNLPNGDRWTQVHDCVEATTAQNTLRVQFYPAPGAPTLEIDDVNVDVSMAANGSFETGGGPWAIYPGTSTLYAPFANGASTAHTGTHFGATNTTDSGGGIYQDVSTGTTAGQTVCGSAWVQTEAPATGASGTFGLFTLGGGAIDGGGVNFSGLGNGDDWTQVHTCTEASRTQSLVRIQFYPTPAGPTLEMDDVNVDESLASNGGFETGPGGWATYPNTNSTFVVVPSGQIKATIVTTPVQPTPQPTPIPLPTGKHALRIKLVIAWTWRYDTTRVKHITVGRMPHGTRFTLACRGKRCPRPLKLAARGPKRIHRLLKTLIGHRYHAGDVLTVSFTAKGWRSERARITIRRGRKPLVRAIRDGRLPRVARG
jgi:hypothetical protein